MKELDKASDKIYFENCAIIHSNSFQGECGYIGDTYVHGCAIMDLEVYQDLLLQANLVENAKEIQGLVDTAKSSIFIDRKGSK